MSNVSAVHRAEGTFSPHGPAWLDLPRWRLPVVLAAAERKGILLLGDLVVLNAALFGTAAGVPVIAPWIAKQLLPLQPTWSISLMLVWTVIAACTGCFNLRAVSRARSLVPRVGLTALLASTVYYFVPHLSAPITQSRGLMLAFSLGTFTLLLGWRLLSTAFLWHPVLRQRVCVVGTDEAARELRHAIGSQPAAGFLFVGYVVPRGAGTGTRGGAGPAVHLLPESDAIGDSHMIGARSTARTLVVHDPEVPPLEEREVLGGEDLLLRLVRGGLVDELVLATGAPLGPESQQALIAAYEAGIRVTPLVSMYELLTGRVPVAHVGNDWVVALPRVAPGLAYSAWKRLIDLSVAVVGLVLTGALLPLVAVANWLDSPGPIFYRQMRVGRLGKSFHVMKFRSMHPAHPAGEAPSPGARAVTRLGRLMRSCRLDELPQCWNILRGEMSLIGPRPFVPEEVDEFTRHIPFFRARLLIRPGLTGWAQINHGYSNTLENARIKLQYDLYYLKHQSIFLDAMIALRTIGVMLRFKGS